MTKITVESSIKYIKDIIPGLIVSVGVAFLSILLSKLFPQIGAASIAIFLGMFVGNLILGQQIFQKGYKFSESNLLAYSIVLLGGTLSIKSLLGLGISGISFIVIQMSITIISAMFIGKKLGFGENFRYLMASGNAVCGSSAIASTAPVINASDKDKGIAITIVNVTGIFLMFILPILSQFLYNQEVLRSSALIGGTLQSIGQVVASGAIVGEEVKDLATIFKIMRVIMLVVVVLLFGYLKNRSEQEVYSDNVDIKGTNKSKTKAKVPWYVFGFFIMCALFSLNVIPESMSLGFKAISNKFEITALAAIGLKVNVVDLVKQGKEVSMYGLGVGTIQVISAIVLISVLF
ncbi:YeiH family protein [Metaclostridioides mangenotii]|uniref:YeiH family protein n=1 Tax=Metaclostridioides mangenotii TaxID=1540 RepID=UPI0026F17145|nr:putative sulfate exporter family transporter [Clostridioides mangenotii]